MWILGSKSKDIFFFYALAIGLSSIYWFSTPKGFLATALFLFIVVFVDAAHVYSTFWRTYALKEERTASRAYWLVPALVFLSTLIWAVLKVPYLWAMVVYFTYFHHLRQIQGISKWYMKINQRFRPEMIKVLYALLLIPFATFHFNDVIPLALYNQNDLFFLNRPEWLHYGKILSLLTWALWIGLEIKVYFQVKKVEVNRILSMLVPAAIHIKCFLYPVTAEGVIFPLLLLHGLTYFAVMSLSLQKLRPQRFSSFSKSLIFVVGLGAIFASFESFGLVEYTILNDEYLRNDFFNDKILIAIFITPTLTHYILDGLIWKKGHPGFEKILSNKL